MTEPHVFVSIKALAARLGMDRSHARRYVLKLGYRPVKRRTEDSGNQLTLTVEESEAKEIIRRREEEGFLGSLRPVSLEQGFLYVIQLVPELHPGRLKLGFAIDVRERVAQHRTAAPTAAVERTWPCRRAWELTAINSMTRKDCRLIANEVFECDDVDALLERGDAFFELMPEVGDRLELADASPLKASNEAADTGYDPSAVP